MSDCKIYEKGHKSLHRIKGIGTALVTPFTASEEVDYEALGGLIDFQISNGVDFLCILGTTAETPVLSQSERSSIVEFSLERINGRVPVVLGCSSNCTRDLAKEIKACSKHGIDAFLSVVPYYNKPTQEGIFRHYEHISGYTDKGIIMYNVPSRTGVNMTAETALRISEECGNVIAIKEASGNIMQANEIIKHKSENFAVLSGDDFLTFPLMALGADGVISVVSNCEPKLFSDMVHSLIAKNYANALGIHNQLLDLYTLLFKDGNPAGVKAALSCKGMANNVLRLPLVTVTDETYNSIKAALDKL